MTTVTIRFPPGTRAVRFPDGRGRFGGRYTARRWFDDPQRMGRFLHWCREFGVRYEVDGQMPLFGGA